MSGIIADLHNGCEHPDIAPELRQTLSGMLTSLEYSPVKITGQAAQPYSFSMHFDARRNGYKVELVSQTTDDRRECTIPMGPFRALIADYGESREGYGFSRNSNASERALHRRKSMREKGAMGIQRSLNAAGIEIPLASAETLFRIVATEYKFEAGIGR